MDSRRLLYPLVFLLVAPGLLRAGEAEGPDVAIHSPGSGIFDAATTSYLVAKLGNGIPSPEGTPAIPEKPPIASYFMTAGTPLLLMFRRRCRRG